MGQRVWGRQDDLRVSFVWKSTARRNWLKVDVLRGAQ